MNRLATILLPPTEPTQLGDWTQAEQELGASFPNDYKAFVDTYGAGRIDDFLAIYTPFATRKGTNLFAQLVVEQQRFQYIQEAGNEDLPFEVWPATSGLIPVGRDDNGNVLFWKTGGSPDGWTIVVFPARSDRYEEFSMTLVEFLAGVLDRKLVVQCYPADFPNERFHVFTRHSLRQ